MKKKPGIVGIIVGIALIVVGVAAGVIVIVTTALDSAVGVMGAETFSSDAPPAEVSLEAGSDMGIWLDQMSVGNCGVLDPSMAEVPLTKSGFVSQTMNDFRLVATFTPPVDGVYTVMCESYSSSVLFKVAPTIATAGLAAGIVVGVLLIVLLPIAGIIVLIVTVVRRSHWNRQYAQPAPMPYPPMQYAPSQVSAPVQPNQPNTQPMQAQPPVSQPPQGQPPAQG